MILPLPLSLGDKDSLFETGNWVEKGYWAEWEESGPCSAFNGTCGSITKSRKCDVIHNNESRCIGASSEQYVCYPSAECGKLGSDRGYPNSVRFYATANRLLRVNSSNYLDHGTIQLFDYGKNLNNTWTIETDCQWVNLTFELIDLNSRLVFNRADYVTLIWPMGSTLGTLNFTSTIPAPYLSTLSGYALSFMPSNFSVNFVSNNNHNAKGFKWTWQCLPDLPGYCMGEFGLVLSILINMLPKIII